MGTLVITGASVITFAALVNNATGTANNYYLHVPPPTGETRMWQKRTGPAVDGIKRKDGGFRYRMHGPFETLIVSSTEALLGSDIAAIKTALEARPTGCTIVYPDGQTASNCFLADGFPRIMGNREYDPASTFWYCKLALMMEEN